LEKTFKFLQYPKGVKEFGLPKNPESKKKKNGLNHAEQVFRVNN